MNTYLYQGKKVRLAIFDAERDAEVMARWNQDSEYQQLQSSGPSSLLSGKQLKDWAEKHYREMYWFSIFTLSDEAAAGDGDAKPDGRLIGSADLAGIDWVSGNAWFGIGIGVREYWGKGYGSEATQLVLDFAFGELNLNRVSLTVFEYNQRAYKSYLKCGFKEEGRERQWMQRAGERYDLIYMGILREEWEAMRLPAGE